MLMRRNRRAVMKLFGLIFVLNTLIGVRAVADRGDRTPLMPHPIEGRPVFSQDKYSPKASEPEVVPEIAPPKFNQDTFEDPSQKKDYTPELRRVPQKGREISEVEIAKGIVALNASRYDEAEKHFKAALEQDPRNFVAMEYLGATEEGRGRFQEALGWYVKAKHTAPEQRWGEINFQLGRVYLYLKNYERAELYLKLAVEQDGHLTAAQYTLGYLYYRQGRYFEAHEHLRRARDRVLRPAARLSERAMLQAIHYYLGEVYARLGFTHYAIATLRETEHGESWEVRNAAWRVHAELNKSAPHLRLGTFLQFDSNTILLPSGGTLPSELTTVGSVSNITTIDGGWQTSPTKRWSFGVDGSFYLNTHFTQELAAFDVLSLATDGWVGYWNQRDWSIKGWYEFSHALTDRTSYTAFQTLHGPAFSVSYAPFQRWNYELGFRHRFNSYADDLTTGPDIRSGTSSVVFLRVGLKTPNPRFRPSLGYTFEYDDAKGINFDGSFHTLHAEASWRVFTKTHLIGSLSWGIHIYPSHLAAREDKQTEFRLGVNHLLTENWMLLGNVVQLDNNSNLNDFQYSRFTFTTGATYTF